MRILLREARQTVFVSQYLHQVVSEQWRALVSNLSICCLDVRYSTRDLGLPTTCRYSEYDRAPYENMDLPNEIGQSAIKHDESGDNYVPCRCKCDNPDVEGLTNGILDVVIEGLSELD